MKLGYHFIILLIAGFALVLVAAEPIAKVRLEMWEGCLCGDPLHPRGYDQLKDERAKRMTFGTNVTVTAETAKLTPLAFLKAQLGDSKLKDRVDFYWMGVVYRPAADGQSYVVHFHGGLRKFKLTDTKDGDLIVYYRESY